MKEAVELLALVVLISGVFGIGYYFALQQSRIGELEARLDQPAQFSAVKTGFTAIINPERLVEYCQKEYTVFDQNGDKICGK